MPRKCAVTGKSLQFGNNVSHSNRKTRRRFRSNLHKHRIWSEKEKRFITLRVSTKGLKKIDKYGLDTVLSEIRGK